MIIYGLFRKDKLLATISKDFGLTPYYLQTLKISFDELKLIQAVAEDLCTNNIDFKEYSKFWINDYKIKILKKNKKILDKQH